MFFWTFYIIHDWSFERFPKFNVEVLKFNSFFFKLKTTEEVYLKLEIKKLKQEVLDMKLEKDTLSQKM